MVREPRPRRPGLALHAVHLEAANVDAVEREDRHLRGVAPREASLVALEHLVELQLLGEVVARLLLPVVEVAGNDERRALGHRGLDALGHPLELETAAARP